MSVYPTIRFDVLLTLLLISHHCSNGATYWLAGFAGCIALHVHLPMQANKQMYACSSPQPLTDTGMQWLCPCSSCAFICSCWQGMPSTLQTG